MTFTKFGLNNVKTSQKNIKNLRNEFLLGWSKIQMTLGSVDCLYG